MVYHYDLIVWINRGLNIMFKNEITLDSYESLITFQRIIKITFGHRSNSIVAFSSVMTCILLEVLAWVRVELLLNLQLLSFMLFDSWEEKLLIERVYMHRIQHILLCLSFPCILLEVSLKLLSHLLFLHIGNIALLQFATNIRKIDGFRLICNTS